MVIKKKLKQNLKIGNLKLKNKYFLAPMLEINDIAFRKLCKKAGASIVYTGMINPRTQQKFVLDDKPALQLFGTSDIGISEFIKKYDKETCLWDFNLGCPAKLARKLGHGVFFHSKTKEIEKILKIMSQVTLKPVTIKLRKSKYVNKIINIAIKYVDAIAIHPRTQEQGYSGKPDLKYAFKVQDKIKKLNKKYYKDVKVIYSGDVSLDNVKEVKDKFDFIMVGRGAIGRPEVFAKLTKTKIKKSDVDFKAYLKLALKYKLRFSQIKFQAMNFSKGMKNAKQIRLKLFKTKTIKDIKKVYDF